jgi:putative thioredoxin
VHEAQEHPDNVEAAMTAADAEFASGSPESAFARLVEFVRSASGDDRDQARARLLQLFDLIDPGDPVVVSARSALANALF